MKKHSHDSIGTVSREGKIIGMLGLFTNLVGCALVASEIDVSLGLALIGFSVSIWALFIGYTIKFHAKTTREFIAKINNISEYEYCEGCKHG